MSSQLSKAALVAGIRSLVQKAVGGHRYGVARRMAFKSMPGGGVTFLRSRNRASFLFKTFPKSCEGTQAPM